MMRKIILMVKIDWLIDWLTDWLIDWLIDWLNDWWLIDLKDFNSLNYDFIFLFFSFWSIILLLLSEVQNSKFKGIAFF